jgi:hypothetical protein
VDHLLFLNKPEANNLRVSGGRRIPVFAADLSRSCDFRRGNAERAADSLVGQLDEQSKVACGYLEFWKPRSGGTGHAWGPVVPPL